MLNINTNIKEPGLNVLPPGVERYVVSGGGLTGIQILPDDEIEILNNEIKNLEKEKIIHQRGLTNLFSLYSKSDMIN